MNSKKQVTRYRLLIALSTLFAVTGCGSQSSPPSSLSQSAGAPAGVEARIFVGNTNGTVSVIEHGVAGNTLVEPIDVFSSVGDMTSSRKNHIFINLGSTNQVAALDPVGDTTTFRKFIPVGQRPVHINRDPEGSRIWVQNDSDPTTGIDTVTAACNMAQTGSVSVIQNHGTAGHDDEEEEVNAGEVLATICVGKGHHKAAFSTPTATDASIPLRTFISNIIDGTISVIDNDPGAEASPNPNYHTVIDTIDLCDPAQETGGTCDADIATPNEAGPHGMVFSEASGKIYNNNEDYGTVNIINPATLAIETTLDIGFAGATHVTPDGRFVIVRGFDSSTVTGKLTVIDVTNPNGVTTHDLVNINPGAIEFTSDGTKMYVAGSGSATRPAQRRDVVLAYDFSGLPTLPAPVEITVGSTTAGRSIGILEQGGQATHVFATNRTEGTVSVIDATSNAVVDTVQVGGTPTSLLVFSLEGDLSHE